MFSLKPSRLGHYGPTSVIARPRLQPVRFQPDAKPNSDKSGRKVLTGPCVIEIAGKKAASTKFTATASTSSASLQDYMANAADHFAAIQLPLGGKMTKLDDQHLQMVVPKIKLMDLWMQPKAVVKVT